MKISRNVIALAGLISLLTAPTHGQYAVLHSFAGAPDEGSSPTYNSLAVSGSILYGMTESGGSAGDGTIFKINADGTGYTNLHSFVGDGRWP